jgi:hypothetical protein
MITDPPEGMPEDIDGSGTWTVAGIHSTYTPEQWERIKSGMLRRRHNYGFVRTVYVADDASPVKHMDPAAIGQYLIGYGVITLVLAVVLTIVALAV